MEKYDGTGLLYRSIVLIFVVRTKVCIMIGGKNKVSIKDIAQKAGVSISLVSFVINGKAREHRVNPQVAEKILQIADELDYRPNALARSLRDGKSHSIGVVLSDISNPFFANIARIIEITAETRDYTVQFSSSDENADRADVLVDNMMDRGMDGIILVPCSGSEKTVKKLLSKEIPFILLDRTIPGINCSHVCLNNRKAAYDCTSHLIGNGFRNIGAISYNVDLKHMTDRIEGFKAAMTEAGIFKEKMVRYVDHASMEKSCDKAVSFLLDNKADAILSLSNTIGVESLRILTARNLEIPEQIGLVTFDGSNAFDFYRSPLTYLKQPTELMARKAAEILIDQIETNNTLVQNVTTEGELVIRESSRYLSDKTI